MISHGTFPGQTVTQPPSEMARRVGLFIPVRNGEAYLPQCVESILAQSFTDWELCIQDNRSTDGTPRIARAYLTDPRVSYLLNEEDLGAIGNFNRALERVATEFYAILSHDDFFFHSDALATALEVMDADPKVAVVYSDLAWVDSEARLIAKKRMPWRGRTAGEEVSRASLVAARNHFGVPVLVRSSLVKGLRYDPAFPLTGDVDFSIACASRGPSHFLPFPAVAIRFHRMNATMRLFNRTRREFLDLARKHGLRLEPLETLRFRINLVTGAWKKRLFFFYLDHLRGGKGRRLLAFLAVGAGNTLLGVLSYGLLLKLGLPFPAASGLSLALGILVGFHSHRVLVFRRPGGFWRYLGVWSAIYLLANALIWGLRPWLGAFLAGCVAMPANALAAFFALNRWVFNGEARQAGPGGSDTRNPLGTP